MSWKKVPDRAEMAKMAASRAGMYDLLAGIFSSLPDKVFVDRIKGRDSRCYLEQFRAINNKRLRAGLDSILEFLADTEHMQDEAVANQLAVDRTRIVRTPLNTELKAPYEGLYKRGETVNSIILKVKSFYRKAGLLPDDSVQETPDYLGIELDFMSNLCRREQGQWESGGEGAAGTLRMEEEFLANHLGSWAGEFCRQAEKDAMTKFYKGFLILLDGVIKFEKKYVSELAGKLR